MKKVKKIIQNVAKNVAFNSVGRSILLLGHETTIPEEVKKWVKNKSE